MRLEGYIIFFVFLVILVSIVRFLWPVLVIVLLYLLIRGLFFPRPTVTRTQNPFEYQEPPRRPRVDGDVIDADFETREVDDD